MKRTDERRRAILEAALRCFSAAGFSATTLEEIRRRSGASTGSIYHHFASKEQIAAAVYVEGLRDYQQGLLAELRRHREGAGGVKAIVTYHLRWVEDHPEWARYLVHMRHTESVAATESEIARLNRGFVAEIRAWVEAAVARGELRRLPPDVFLALVLGPAQEMARIWLTGRAPTPLPQARRLLAEAAWRSVGVPPSKEVPHAR